MTQRVRYTNKTGTVGYGYIDLRGEFEKQMQEEGRKLGATLAWIGRNDVRGIKYDDKHSFKLKIRGLECEGIKFEGVTKAEAKNGKI